jgi:hypothetical protein
MDRRHFPYRHTSAINRAQARRYHFVAYSHVGPSWNVSQIDHAAAVAVTNPEDRLSAGVSPHGHHFRADARSDVGQQENGRRGAGSQNHLADQCAVAVNDRLFQADVVKRSNVENGGVPFWERAEQENLGGDERAGYTALQAEKETQADIFGILALKGVILMSHLLKLTFEPRVFAGETRAIQY